MSFPGPALIINNHNFHRYASANSQALGQTLEHNVKQWRMIVKKKKGLFIYSYKVQNIYILYLYTLYIIRLISYSYVGHNMGISNDIMMKILSPIRNNAHV